MATALLNTAAQAQPKPTPPKVNVTAQARATYSPQLALAATYIAGAAYCGPPSFSSSKLAAWACGPECGNVSMSNVQLISGKDDDAFGYVGVRQGQCVVAFRGTSDLKGWMEDLESAATAKLSGCSYQGKPCYVGDGFLSNYQSMAPAMKAALSKLGCSSGPPVWVIGHSLGAAEATLAMWDLHASGVKLAAGYTFGQPRVGDAAFAQAFRQAGIQQWRVTNARLLKGPSLERRCTPRRPCRPGASGFGPLALRTPKGEALWPRGCLAGVVAWPAGRRVAAESAAFNKQALPRPCGAPPARGARLPPHGDRELLPRPRQAGVHHLQRQWRGSELRRPVLGRARHDPRLPGG